MAFLISAACTVLYEQVQENANVAIYARMAYMDTMTGLGNRTAFLEENKSNATFPGMISYIMMDANNLKKINDTLGHNKGDELIVTIAKCMRTAVGDSGQCYRIGGDEFVIILKNKDRHRDRGDHKTGTRRGETLLMSKVIYRFLLQ